MRKLLLAIVLATLLPAVPAAASSIAYVKGGDVWLAAPDGSGQRKVTTGGGYTSVSQADDGTVVALHGTRLHRIDRNSGAVQSNVATVVANANYEGPFDVRISPDGKKVGYHWAYQHRENLPGCPILEHQCQNGEREVGTTIAAIDTEPTTPPVADFLFSDGLAWVHNGEVMLSQGTLTRPRVAKVPIVLGGGTRYWFPEGWSLSDPAISPMTNRAAWVSYGWDIPNSSIIIWDTRGAAGDFSPVGCSELSGPAGRLSDPSFSPDGRILVWGEGADLWSTPVPTACNATGMAPRLLIAGASSPSFGKADAALPQPPPPPPPPPTPPVPRPPVPGPRPPETRGPETGGDQVEAPKVATAGALPKLGQLAKKRVLTLSLSCDGACRLRVTASLARRVARRLKLKAVVATAAANGSGRLSVKLRLPAKVAKKLARQRSVSLTVVASGTDAAGASRTVRTTLQLRR